MCLATPPAAALGVVDGACIFLNRPGISEEAGCALHLAALDSGDSPIDFKPSVCWQAADQGRLERKDDGTEIATVRGWTRGDWGAEGDTMAWCCTEGTEAYVGDRPVVESMAEELDAVVGTACTSSFGVASATDKSPRTGGSAQGSGSHARPYALSPGVG